MHKSKITLMIWQKGNKNTIHTGTNYFQNLNTFNSKTDTIQLFH